MLVSETQLGSKLICLPQHSQLPSPHGPAPKGALLCSLYPAAAPFSLLLSLYSLVPTSPFPGEHSNPEAAVLPQPHPQQLPFAPYLLSYGTKQTPNLVFFMLLL